MKLRSLLALGALLLTGCNTLTFTAVRPDGTQVTIKSTRVVWSTESYRGEVSGFGSLTATKSTVDTAAIAAAAEGAARGIMMMK